MEKVLLVFALLGSAGYMFDKLYLLMSARKKTTQAPQDDAIRAKDALIAELQGRIRVLEVQLAAAREQEASPSQQPVQQEFVEQPDPLVAITRDAESRAASCLVESKRFAMAAIEATGREKSRLLAEAKAMADKAAEYRAIGNGALPQERAKSIATEAIEKAKQPVSKRLKQDEVARERAKFEQLA